MDASSELSNATTSTTTERYRISRQEFGYILGRNYRGLKKLFRIELNEALNVMEKPINFSFLFKIVVALQSNVLDPLILRDYFIFFTN